MVKINQNGMKSTIYKPTIAKAIGHVMTTSFVENTFKTTIVKSDVSDHLPICIVIPSTNVFTKNEMIY